MVARYAFPRGCPDIPTWRTEEGKIADAAVGQRSDMVGAIADSAALHVAGYRQAAADRWASFTVGDFGAVESWWDTVEKLLKSC